MLKRLMFILILTTPMVALAVDNSQNPEPMILIGTKDKVLLTLQEALDLEFTNGKRSNLIENIGFEESFTDFWSGKLLLRVVIFPMVNGNALEPTAYRVNFSYHTAGKSYVISLISRIKSVIAKQNYVTTTENLSDYIPLAQQMERCIDTFKDDADLILLRGKMSFLSSENQTFDMLANDNIPTDEERKIIHLFAIKREECMKSYKLLGTFWPNEPRVTLKESAENTYVQLILSLYKGQLTYGNFAKIQKDNQIMLKEAIDKILLEKKQQQSAENDRAKLLALEQQRLFIEKQKTYTNLYRAESTPIQTMKSTTCSFHGNQMYCNSF